MLKVWGSCLAAMSIVLFAGAAFGQNACDTDYNGDGVTDAADVEIFQAALGSEEGDLDFVARADHNEDGLVSTVDFVIFVSCN